jgi:hypothetical protein
MTSLSQMTDSGGNWLPRWEESCFRSEAARKKTEIVSGLEACTVNRACYFKIDTTVRQKFNREVDATLVGLLGLQHPSGWRIPAQQ